MCYYLIIIKFCYYKNILYIDKNFKITCGEGGWPLGSKCPFIELSAQFLVRVVVRRVVIKHNLKYMRLTLSGEHNQLSIFNELVIVCKVYNNYICFIVILTQFKHTRKSMSKQQES